MRRRTLVLGRAPFAARGVEVSWFEAGPEIVVAVALLLVPGALVVLATGARGLIAWGAAAPVSAAVAGVAAIMAELAGSSFSIWWEIAATAVALVLVGAVRWVFLRDAPVAPRESRRTWGAFAIGMTIAVVLLSWRVSTALISPQNFSQRFDIVFHLNAVRRAIEGDGSSLTMGTLMGEGGILSFYPAAWHDLAALVSLTTGIDHGVFTIPVAVSATNLVIAAVVWPLGCLALVRAIAGAARPHTLILGGVLSAAFGAFPLRLLDWGVILPYFFGIALFPGVLALVIAAARIVPRPSIDTWRALVILAVCAVGLGLSHTSTITALAALAAPVVFTAVLRWVPSRTGPRWRLPVSRVAVLALYVAVLVLIWYVGRPYNGFPGWETPRSLPVALGLLFANAPFGGMVPVVAMILVGVGIVVCIVRREKLWFLGMYGITAILYVVVAGFPQGILRSVLTGPWYEDTFRVGAFLIVLGVPAAAMGADILVRRTTLAWRRRARSSPRMPGPAWLTLVVVLLLIPATQITVAHDTETTRQSYVLNDDSELISPNEIALLQRLDAEVPPDAVIADNPWDGSALAWALAGRHVLVPHLLSRLSPAQTTIAQHLRDAVAGDDVCAVSRQLGVEYVLDFGRYAVNYPGSREYPGLDDLETSGAVTPVDREGDAVLYRLTACE